MTIAEYIARLKAATEKPGHKIINIIYGYTGDVVGNVEELLKVAELLLKERDEAILKLAQADVWPEQPPQYAIDALKVAINPSDSECSTERIET